MGNVTGFIRLVLPDGQEVSGPTGSSLIDLVPDIPQDVLAAQVDGETVHLRKKIWENGRLNWLTLSSEAGARVYQRSLCLLLFTAVEELFPGGEVRIQHSLSKGFFGELKIGRPVGTEDWELLNKKMREIVQENRPILPHKILASKGAKVFEKKGQFEKAELLKQLGNQEIVLYRCNKTLDYLYGPTVYATGLLELFASHSLSPGFLLSFPLIDNPTKLPDYVPQPKLAKVFREAESWADVLDCRFVSNLNDHIEEGKFAELVTVSEAFHIRKLVHLADQVAQRPKSHRLICIAGPSSSGKTTFAERLKVFLEVNGLKPVMISVDDYFKDREHTPKKPDGTYDFEHLEAIDLELFNEHVRLLLQGEPVELPRFNFVEGVRGASGKITQVGKLQPIIIEGIHGLNEKLTAEIPRGEKFKIYISALTQLALDNHNRISTTDARLLRRLVRDHQYRGATAERTLEMWASVRAGEEEFIFPYQEEADIMFNSALIYELAVLKKWAEPLLRSVEEDSPVIGEAKKLLRFLEYFYEADSKAIPEMSILREFIGPRE